MLLKGMFDATSLPRHWYRGGMLHTPANSGPFQGGLDSDSGSGPLVANPVRHEEHLCPRCDYEVTGLEPPAFLQVEAKPESSLPVGRCPECGFEFSWRELTRRVPPPPWSLEPAQSIPWTRVPGRALMVLRRSLSPAALWQPVEVIHVNETLPHPAPSGLLLAHPVQAGRVLYSLACSFAASWIVSVAFLALLGGLSYGLVTLRHDTHAAHQGAVASTNPAGAMRVFPRATLTQFAADNSLNLLLPGVPWTRASADTQRIIVMTVWVLVVALVMPFAFLLLGQTMNRHKVQRRHLWRVAAYSFVPIPVLATAFSGLSWTIQTIEGVRIWLTNASAAASLDVSGYAWAHRERGWRIVRILDDHLMFSIQQWVTREGAAFVALLALGFIWLFWLRASSRYLRLPRSAPDTLALLFVSLLVAPAVGYVTILGIRYLSG